ncbi:MAG: mechanosensitive ion channel [Gammaproteobacteria bacterium]|jgi:small-conductance mechanosensitive channel|nr:mechanosensitive ion channel [Gammaproteobacteria bacterium]
MLYNPTIPFLSFNEHDTPTLISLIFLVGLYIILWGWSRGKNEKYPDASPVRSVIKFAVRTIRVPVSALIFLYIGHLMIQVGSSFFPSYFDQRVYRLIDYLFNIAEYSIYFWIVIKIFHSTKLCLLHWLAEKKKRTSFVIFSALSQSLQAALIMLMVNFFIPVLGITGVEEELLEKITHLLLIGTLGWIFIQIIDSLAQLILHHIDVVNDHGIRVRAINTQVLLLKKILQTIIIVITAAAGLMTFESVRSLGTGLLTTAGIIGAAGAFASQQSLSRLFTGLQLAFSQPIRIGDTVIIENENGQIEEINLSYVVVKLWDLRRLILPTDYFFSKGLQNLTLNSTELLGTIFIYADYTLPIDIIREKFHEYVNQSELWNRNIATFQVTDMKEKTMELRGLVSAKDGDSLWRLRCEVREKLIKFIVKNYPQMLSVKRIANITINPETSA